MFGFGKGWLGGLTMGHPAAPATARMVKRDARLGDSAADHRLTSLVTAWELRLLDHPGM